VEQVLSEQDRSKWNSRYAAGAYSGRREPSEIVRRALALLPQVPQMSGRALDVACGAGRNALHLAACGFVVDAIDISAEGLQRGRDAALARQLAVNWIERDLSESPEIDGPYQLIVMVRYVNAPLLDVLVKALAPGGLLVVEQHLRADARIIGDAQVIGPRSAQFRVEPGTLIAATASLETLDAFEGLTRDPDGRPVALAQVIARQSDT
jgi:tellurite methyltransferase